MEFPVQLSFSSNAFRSHSLRETIGILSGLGYRALEIMADIPHAYPPRMSAVEIDALRDSLRQHQMRVANINAFTLQAQGDTWNPSWIDPNPERRRQRIEHTRHCIDLAVRLGAPHISTEPGGPLPPGMSVPTALDLFRRGLLDIEAQARAAGVRVLIEPEPGLLIETGEQFVSFMVGLDAEVFGLNFDIGHFFCAGEDPAQAIVGLRQWIHHFHLEDIAANRAHQHLVPGEGAIDFRQVFAAMDAIDYRGHVTVELYTCADRPAEAAERSMRHLRHLLH
jgi:sugar phosphate isomerase/epimerase